MCLPGLREAEDDDGDSGMVTVARGYVDVIKRVMQLEGQVAPHDVPLDDVSGAPGEPAQNPEDVNTFILAWRPQHWRMY